ncbi:hypothetical protein KIW84_055709 [Lathyrus oleraceus]|uniref:Ubiquitin-like protease family profile domain-containing protein n=1 Tax=Pisum sativum TaxID=3888 RepID=A0A9D5AK48_PEA|nr:hypothetical protein KIW84_055709 [Pisum sativum]
MNELVDRFMVAGDNTTPSLYFLPFNSGNGGHWVLVAMDLSRLMVYYLDSLPGDWSKYQSMKKTSKLKKGLMETWYKLDDDEYSDREAEDANLALMALTLSDSESESGSSSKSDEEDKVYFNLSCSDLIHGFMILCQD